MACGSGTKHGCIRLQPSNFALHANLGQLLLDAGRGAEALQHFEEAARLAPDSTRIAIMLAHAYAQNGRANDAIPVLERALRQAQADGDVELAREIDSTIRAAAPRGKR